MKCRKCKTTLKKVPQFDLANFFEAPQMYCENKECEHFGFITIAGIKDEDVTPPDDKPTTT